MKLLLPSILLAVSGSLNVLAKERPRDPQKHLRYESGEVMDRIMALKEANWDEAERLGLFNPKKFTSSNGFHACKDGHVTLRFNKTETTFQCNNLDLTGHLTHQDLGSKNESARIGSSVWGFTIEGREFVSVAQIDGAAFAEVVGKGWWNYIPFFGKAEGTLDYIGRLPPQSIPSLWREIRDYKGRWAIIGSEAVDHGIQIFDTHKLLEVRPWYNRLSTKTKEFSITDDISHFGGLPIGRSHNVVAAPSSNHILAVGAQPRNSTCRSGLIFIDVSDINNPVQSGCASEDGYVHDAQCLIYRGPDKKYAGREICYGYNEDSLTVYDITDKQNPVLVSNTSYDGASYTHQGWVLEEDNQDFLILDDEYDEVDKEGPAVDQFATTYIWNISSLEAPVVSGTFKSKNIAIDHNQYIKNFYAYQSQYGAGLRIVDVSSIRADPTGAGVHEVAFFDVFPEDDTIVAEPKFVGSWGNYPFFKSGHIVINTYDRGAFVVKRSKKINGKVRADF